MNVSESEEKEKRMSKMGLLSSVWRAELGFREVRLTRSLKNIFPIASLTALAQHQFCFELHMVREENS